MDSQTSSDRTPVPAPPVGTTPTVKPDGSHGRQKRKTRQCDTAACLAKNTCSSCAESVKRACADGSCPVPTQSE